MANKKRPTARKAHKKGPTKGSGGKGRRSLRGKGPTPKAEDRVYHPAHQRKLERERRRQGKNSGPTNELVVGRNPVIECLEAGVPALRLLVAQGTGHDERLSKAVDLATKDNVPIDEVPRFELDRRAGNTLHQGIGVEIPPYQYATPRDLLDAAHQSGEPGLVVMLDNITDPRNLGAVIRSTAAFGGHGVIIPERRTAAVTAVAWRTSAGTAARLPVARATNLNRTIKEFQKENYQVVGLEAGGDAALDDYDATTPVLLVIGSEGKGLSRLVRENCDTLLSIPTADWVESLNASVAAGAVLSEFARQRRAERRPRG